MDRASQENMDRLLAEGILPHATRIAEIAEAGGIPVLVFELSDASKKAARKMGWDKFTPVFRLREEDARQVAIADRVTAAWINRSAPRPMRLLVLWNAGTLLLNCGDGGWYLEPGSTEAELKQTRN